MREGLDVEGGDLNHVLHPLPVATVPLEASLPSSRGIFHHLKLQCQLWSPFEGSGSVPGARPHPHAILHMLGKEHLCCYFGFASPAQL